MAKIDQLQDIVPYGEQRGKINQALKSVETDSTITGDGDSSPLSVVAENIKATSTDQNLVLAPDGVGGVEFRAEQGGGGTGDHTQLTNRDLADQHPISAITGLPTALDDKVDKVAGKGLSTEDYTTAEKSKLSGVQDNAQVNPDDLQIKIQYESNADTNAYTDAEKTNVAKIILPENYDPKKLFTISEDGTAIEQTAFTYEEIVELSKIDTTDPTWLENEERLLLVKKVADAAQFESAAQLIDIFAPSSIDSELNDQNGWENEEKVISGENFLGQIGKVGQVRILVDGTICRVISSVQGSEGGADGSATYKRNRAVDVLDPDNNTQDNAVCDLLDPTRTGGGVDDGWNLTTNTKLLAVPCRIGTWWKSDANYSYFCYGKSGANFQWVRIGTPQAIYRMINTTSHPTLTANLLVHDFVASAYTEQGGDEVSYQDQAFYDSASRKYFIKVESTKWEVLR